MRKQVFMDTSFLLAVIDRSDKYHSMAVACYKQLVEEKRTVITTEAVLVEIGNGLSNSKWRQVAYQWITRIRNSRTIFTVVSTTSELLSKAIELYGSRSDKKWSLTDCISFIVMSEQNLSDALTVDHHFEQAGYKIYLNMDK